MIDPQAAVQLAGIIPVLATPFTERGEVDLESFERQVESGIVAGVNGLAMFGLASEYYKLTAAERETLTRTLLRRVARRVPVIVSITSHATEVAAEEARIAAAMGADALMVLPPFFLHPPTDQIVKHLEIVAQSVAVPIVIQYAPAQTGVPIGAGIFADLQRRCPNVNYIKVDALPSGPTVSAIRKVSQDTLQTLTGYMGLDLPEALARGAAGCMPTLSLSRAFLRLFELLRTCEADGRSLHRRLLPLLQFLMQSVEILIAGEKYLLSRQGILASRYSRSPSASLDSYQTAELDLHWNSLSELLI